MRKFVLFLVALATVSFLTISVFGSVSGQENSVGTRYDTNGDNKIDVDEALAAIVDYFSGLITVDEALEILVLYFSQDPIILPTLEPPPGPILPGHDPPVPEEESLSAMIKRVRPSVVKIFNGSQASGVIFDTRGQTAYVMTNSHVVDDGDESIIVRVHDEDYYEGTLLRRDPVRDLAVVTICCDNFTAAEFGSSDDINVGDDLIVMGYPYGSSLVGPASATKGIVSAKPYSFTRDRIAVQTDAATNPGSSGGPHLSLDGRVVAIHVSSLATARSEGLHFGVAESTVQEHLSALRTPGGEAIFEGISGNIYHDPQDPLIEGRTFLVGFDGAADVEIETTFVNPYAASDHAWSHGLTIRRDPDPSDDEYLPRFIFVIHSSKTWYVLVAHEDSNYVLLADGSEAGIRVGNGERNHLKVSALGEVATFYINNVQVGGNINLGSFTHHGHIQVVVGFVRDTEREGAVTRFENLRGRIIE